MEREARQRLRESITENGWNIEGTPFPAAVAHMILAGPVHGRASPGSRDPGDTFGEGTTCIGTSTSLRMEAPSPGFLMTLLCIQVW